MRRWAPAVRGFVGAAVATLLFFAAVAMVKLEREAGGVVALGVPTWVAQLVMPVGFAALALRLVWSAEPGWGGRAVAAAGLALGALLATHPAWTDAERHHWLDRLRADGIAPVTIETSEAIVAGFRVVSGNNVLDATLEGLLADRGDLEGRLPHHLQQEHR